MLEAILDQFAIHNENTTIQAFGSGLINHTWCVENTKGKYILQQINEQVFTNPLAIDKNFRSLASYLSQHFPNYFFTVPLATIDGKTLVQNSTGSYRLFSFVKGSHSVDVVQQPQLACEAAKQFGHFTQLLSGFDANSLQITLPHFHDLSLRYQQFKDALKHGNPERLEHSKTLIDELLLHTELVDFFANIQQNPSFKKRVTHHDTKISNVLFDDNNQSICVIDLDTVMPGYFISDVGDMMRTYLSAVGEEETDLTKIDVREEYFDAIVKGYLGEMKDELSVEETNAFVYAGKFMIYMQALRFLTDYLNNDVDYGAKYEKHNFNRAANQITLLNALINKETALQKKVAEFLKS